MNLKKAPYTCFGFEWMECEDSLLDILEQSNCSIVEEQVRIETKPIRIDLHDSLLERFNELSEDELKDSFGTFTPVQSLNPYMTRISMCTIKQARLKSLFKSQRLLNSIIRVLKGTLKSLAPSSH